MKSLGCVLISAAIVALALGRPTHDTTTEAGTSYEELMSIVDNLIKSEYKADGFDELEPVFKIMEEGLDHLGDVDETMLEYCVNRTGVTEADTPENIDFDHLSEPMQCMFTCVAEQKGIWKDGHVSGPLAILKSLAWLINTKYHDQDPSATKWASQSHSCFNIVDEVGCEGFVGVFKCIRDIEMYHA